MRQLVSDTRERLEGLCLDATGPIGLAVSGGGDSMALLHLALQWRPAAELIAFTVDHGLRPEAKAEAGFVKDGCEALGVRHETLTWTPSIGHISQARARRARHGLLANALRDQGGTHLLFGHTLDDQYETALMRSKTSETGVAGMRGLSVSPVWPEGRDVFLARPLLACRRVELREVLTAASQDWIDDPSNLDPKFERVRVRQTLAVSKSEEVSSLHARYRVANEERVARDLRLWAWLDHAVQAHADGLVVFDPSDISPQDLAGGLGYLLLVASGSDRLTSLAARLELASDIKEAPGKWRSRTLGGAWIAPRQGVVHIARDPGLIPEMPRVTDLTGRHIWDGRFEIRHGRPREDQQPFHAPIDAISALARPSYPTLSSKHDMVRCLVPERLNSLKRVLGHETCVFAC